MWKFLLQPMIYYIHISITTTTSCKETDFGKNSGVIKWKHLPRYWPFVRWIHRPPLDSPHKGQWRGALMFSLIFAWTNGWAKSRDAGDLRRHPAHYDVFVMNQSEVLVLSLQQIIHFEMILYGVYLINYHMRLFRRLIDDSHLKRVVTKIIYLSYHIKFTYQTNDYQHGWSRLSNWFCLRCLVQWMNHLPPRMVVHF